MKGEQMSEKRKGAIPIAAAKKVSQEHGCPIVLIFGIEADGCHYTVTTYGHTKPLCAWAAKLSSDIQQAVMAGKVLGDVEHAHNPYELIAALRHERDALKALLPLCKQILEWDEKEWEDDGAGFDALRPTLIDLRAAYALAMEGRPQNERQMSEV